MTREDLIEKYVATHAECRWMDAGDLDDLLHSFVRELDLLELPEGLDEAAENYAHSLGYDEEKDKAEIAGAKEDFIAGAEWGAIHFNARKEDEK